MINKYLEKFKTANQTMKYQVVSPRVLSVYLKQGEMVYAKVGSMVAYYGSCDFSREGRFEHGFGKALKEAFSGDGMSLMRCKAKKSAATVYFSDEGKKIVLLKLEAGEKIVVNGEDVLMFNEGLKWDIKLLKSLAGWSQGGLFSVSLEGPGFVALCVYHDPIVLQVKPNVPLRTDPQNTVFWSGNLKPKFKSNIKIKSLFGRSSGEEFQMKWEGTNGYVGVQSQEEGGKKK